MNLYTNAYQSMQGNGGILTIITDKAKLDGNSDLNIKKGTYCRISVKDTGHGIERRIQKRIFEPFFTTKPVGQGPGMGLSVVHGIVSRCGGGVEVESAPGKGACFNVYLPLAQKADLEKRKREKEISYTKGRRRILFVDDDIQICDSQKKALEPLGYTVTVIPDSRVAEEVFAKNSKHFDLVILDLNMPHLDGFELAERIIKIRADIPVILATGYAELVDLQKVEKLGFKSLLLKPYRLDDISRLIAENLKSNKKSWN
jgi:CheY-like chemotaxis protein